MQNQRVLVHRTADNVEIFTEPGVKSTYDFKVRYREPDKRIRTPRHVHLIVDLYQKRGVEPALTNAFAGHIIDNIIRRIEPVTTYPPTLQVFETEHISRFEGLSGVSEYSPEFLLVVVELIMIQEKTNYPDGVLNLDLFQSFRNGDDIFSVMGQAVFRGR